MQNPDIVQSSLSDSKDFSEETMNTPIDSNIKKRALRKYILISRILLILLAVLFTMQLILIFIIGYINQVDITGNLSSSYLAYIFIPIIFVINIILIRLEIKIHLLSKESVSKIDNFSLGLSKIVLFIFAAASILFVILCSLYVLFVFRF